MKDCLVTTQEAADYLGVSTSFLEKDRWRGAKIPFVRLGKRTIRYRKSDLDNYIAQQLYRSTSEYQAA